MGKINSKLGSYEQQTTTTTTEEEKKEEIKPRKNYIEWEEYFMSLAFLSGDRSKDPHCQVGACIVNQDNRIVGLGYNGFPSGIKNNDSQLPWKKGKDLDNKHFFVCHAEMNAILNKNNTDLKNCTIYVTLYPCCDCAKLIIQSGIKKVVYYSNEKSEKAEFRAAAKLFKLYEIKNVLYSPTRNNKIIISKKNGENIEIQL